MGRITGRSWSPNWIVDFVEYDDPDRADQESILSKIGPGAAVVLRILERHANKDGLSWPKIPTIARKTGLKDRTVRRHLRALEGFGLIEKASSGKGGRQKSTKYRLFAKSWLDCQKLMNPDNDDRVSDGGNDVNPDIDGRVSGGNGPMNPDTDDRDSGDNEPVNPDKNDIKPGQKEQETRSRVSAEGIVQGDLKGKGNVGVDDKKEDNGKTATIPICFKAKSVERVIMTETQTRKAASEQIAALRQKTTAGLI